MLCPKCGNEVFDSHSVCPKCGHELQVSPSALITSAVPHITSFSFDSPPKTPKVVDNNPSSPPTKPSLAVKKSSRWPFVVLFISIILIVGVYFSEKISGLDPFEKKRLAQDTAVKNTITNLLSSLNTYNTTNSQYPWTGNSDGYSSLDIASEAWFSSLSISPPASKIILIQEANSAKTVHLCFLPQSRVNITAAKEKCFSGNFFLQYSASVCVKNREYLCFP